MKKYVRASFPSYEEIRRKVNGYRKNATTFKPTNDTQLVLEDDCVRLDFRNWRGGTWTIVRYYPDHMAISMPFEYNGERTSVANRLFRVISEFVPATTSMSWHDGVDVQALYKGPYKGELGLHRESPVAEKRMDWRTKYVSRSLAAIPFPRGKTVRLSYNLKDLDGITLSKAQQNKLFETFKKRSKAGRDRIAILQELGFAAHFWLEGYPVPKGLTLEKAKALRTVANAMGFEDVERAWRANVFVGAEMTEEDAEMFGEGLANMFVEFHKQRKKDK